MSDAADAALGAGLEAQAQGRLEDARIRYAEVLAMESEHVGALFLTGLSLQLEGHHTSALAWFRRGLSLAPDDEDLLYASAQSLRAIGARDAALDAYAAASERAPARDDILDSWGTLLLERGSASAALDVLERARALAPQRWTAALHHGNALLAVGRAEAALDAFDAALAMTHESAVAHRNRGLALLRLSRAEDALAAFAAARALDATDPETPAAECAARLSLDQLDAAVDAAAAAAALAPGDVAHGWRHAHALQSVGRWREAIDAWSRVVAGGGGAGAQIRAATVLPVIAASEREIDEVRARFVREVRALRGAELVVRQPEFEIAHTGYHLALHGRCNREPLVALAELHLEACPDLGWRAPQLDAVRPQRDRLRIGFSSRFLCNHSIGKTSRGLVARLDRREFEVIAIHSGPPKHDAMHQWIRAHADENLDLPQHLDEARHAVAAASLDVLFHQDVGMDAFTYFLAFARLAPVQCVSFGYPDTTGIPNMDWWVSTDHFEPADGDMHYSEQLWRAPEIGTLAYYYRPPPSEDGRDRVALGMPTGRAVHFCPHSMFRFTPAFDALLTRLLEEDGSAELWMVDAQPEITRLWQQRFARVAGPKLQQRVRILPRQPHASYLALMHAADTVLDPIDFNGMNNSLDAFAAGVPVVTLPSGLQRGRHASGMYRAMQLTDCVADSEERYVEIAVRLGRDADFRRDVRKAVVERRDVLFEDDRVPRAFESFFRHACGR